MRCYRISEDTHRRSRSPPSGSVPSSPSLRPNIEREGGAPSTQVALGAQCTLPGCVRDAGAPPPCEAGCCFPPPTSCRSGARPYVQVSERRCGVRDPAWCASRWWGFALRWARAPRALRQCLASVCGKPSMRRWWTHSTAVGMCERTQRSLGLWSAVERAQRSRKVLAVADDHTTLETTVSACGACESVDRRPSHGHQGGRHPRHQQRRMSFLPWPVARTRHCSSAVRRPSSAAVCGVSPP